MQRVSFSVVLALVVASFLAPAAVTAGVNSWTSAGPTGGDVTSVAVSPTDPSTVLVASGLGDGVWRTTDGGVTWTPIDTGLSRDPFGQFPAFNQIAIAQSFPSTVYALGFHQVFSSSDGGDHWTQTAPVTTTPSSPSLDSLAVDPTDANVVYVGGSNAPGVFKSADGGQTWNPMSSGLTNHVVKALAVDPVAHLVVYAGTVDGPFKTTDGGGTWNPMTTGLPASRDIRSLTVAASSHDTVYAAIATSVVGPHVYRSDDGGTTWTPQSGGLASIVVVGVAVSPLDAQIAVAATDDLGMFTTTNGGGSWTPHNSGVTTFDFTSVAMSVSQPQTVYAGASFDGGLFRSTDGGATWTPANGNRVATSIPEIAMDPTDPQILLAGTVGNGIFRSSDGGASWTRLPNTGLDVGESVEALAIAPGDPSRVYLAAPFKIYASSDGGQTWSAGAADLGTVPNNVFVQQIAVDPQNADVAYATTLRTNFFSNARKGLLRTVDGGATWQPSNGGIGAKDCISVVVDPTNPQVVYLGTESGVYKSTDGGSSWTAANTGIGVPVPELDIDPTDPQVLYAFTSESPGRLFTTTDGAANWTQLLPGPGNDRLQDLVVDPAAPGTLYAATVTKGVLRSTDGGLTWSPFDIGPATAPSYEVISSPDGRSLHAGTAGHGVTDLDLVVRPDVAIKKGPSFLGDNLYNTTGSGQAVTLTTRRGKKATFTIQVQSDGADDQVKLVGSKAPKGFVVKYLLGTQVVTSQITGAGLFQDLDAGDSLTLKLVVTVKSTAPTSTKTFAVTATSAIDTSVADSVRARVKVPRP